MFADIVLAFGLVFVVEGLVYLLAPSLVEQLLAMIRALSEEQRRVMGLLAVTLGIVLVWAAHLLGA
ncbi:MAG: DUF2065 domain-containing protein [Pseudomonadota bacterium]